LILALIEDQVVPFETSGREVRQHNPGPPYSAQKSQAAVTVATYERDTMRTMASSSTPTSASSASKPGSRTNVHHDPELPENAGLSNGVSKSHLIHGSFDPSYLELPKRDSSTVSGAIISATRPGSSTVRSLQSSSRSPTPTGDRTA